MKKLATFFFRFKLKNSKKEKKTKRIHNESTLTRNIYI